MAFRQCLDVSEVTKIVLPKVSQNFEKTPNCTCWPRELNQKGFPRKYNTGRDQRVPTLDFLALCDFFSFFSTKSSQIFWSFATEWMLKNPKGSSLSVCFGIVRFFSIFFHKRLQIHQYFDILKSFC